MSSGTPVDTKHARLDTKHARLGTGPARRRRLRAAARVRARRAETALDRLRSRAARALAPDPDGVLARRAAVREAERAVRELDADGRVFTRRDTGARIRTRDTQAVADPVPRPSRADRYEVECLTHHGAPLSFGAANAAARAARRSEEWCEGCRHVYEALHPARRARTLKVLTRRA